jgi:S-adenosylmethionine decarboxylase
MMEVKAPFITIEENSARNYRVIGKHVYGSAMECNPDKLMDEAFLTNLVIEAAKVGNMTLLDVKSWKLNPGVTVIGVIVESHISIHTWPEYGFATIDVYACGEASQPEKAFDYIVDKLEAKYVVKGYADRSLV